MKEFTLLTSDREKKKLESAEASTKHSAFHCNIHHIIKEHIALCCIALNTICSVLLKW